MKILNLLPAIMLATLLLVLGACNKKTCPTYSSTKWDTVPATYADVNAFIHQDTTPHTFTSLEKTLAVLGILFIVYATDKNQAETQNK